MNLHEKEVDSINRKLFITELSKYLASMPPEERDAVINGYERRFDEAGAEGEQALLKELGSPTRVAISLLREQKDEPLSAENAGESRSEEGPAYREEILTGEKEIVFDTPVVLPVKPEEIPARADEAGEDEDDGFSMDVEDEDDEEEDFAEKPRSRTLAVIGCVLLCIVTVAVALVLLVLPACALIPGIGALTAGLASFAYLPDTLLLLGMGAIGIGLGLALLWLIVWACVSLLRVLIRRLRINRGTLVLPEGGHEI